MPDLADFHFLRPAWLFALILLPLAPVLLARRQRDPSGWSQHCDSDLLPHVVIRTPTPYRRWTRHLPWLGGVLAVLALAGPTLERLPAPAYRAVSALVIVLDLSPAMLAADFKPSRIERVRYKITDLLQRRREGQTALLVFGGEAFTVTPLTDDTATIIAQLSALTPTILPVQGQRIDRGLDQAVRLLQQAGVKQGDILLLTAADLVAPDAALADRIHQDGYRISVLGTGTVDGAPIPLPRGGFLKNDSGATVLARMDEALLASLASRGGGLYHNLSDDSTDIDALTDFLARQAQTGDDEQTASRIDRWQELGPWLVIPLLPLAALGFRRGWLGGWLLVCLVASPEPARAMDWQAWWKTPDQQGQEALARGQPQAAARLFENPDWKGAAAYQAGQYEDSAHALSGRTDARSQYNLGNALARQGRYQDALNAYDRALQQTPHDEDTRYNRELVKKALEQQQGKPESGKPDANQGEKSGPAPEQPADNPNRAEGQSGQSEQSGSQPDTADKAETAEPASGKTEPAHTASEAAAAQSRQAENRQADEQWLRRIPDDPGGLLKRKFYYQYQQRMQAQ